jgi:hypothetical protein
MDGDREIVEYGLEERRERENMRWRGIERYWNMVWRRAERVEHEMEGDREIVEYGMEARREDGT